MIGTDEMSSTGMDISESFRPEDISKSDFFDFVTASEMGIGVGIGIGSVSGVGGVSLQAQHQQQQQQQYTQQQQQQHQTTHQQSQNHERLSASSNMTHDGGGTSGRNGNDVSNNNSISNSNTSDPTLQSYEFWHTEKENSRLDSSIFEDLDRFCWQQPTTPTPTPTTSTTLVHQQQQQQQTHLQTPAISVHNSNNNNNNNNNNNSNNSNQCDPLNIRANHNAQTNSTAAGSNVSISQSRSSPNATTTLQDNDGQIYTITVLNGGNGNNGEATSPITTTATTTTSWLKRETDDSQLPATLDLDSLFGNFSGYIKSEYPYDDSGFSTDGTKSDGLNGDVNGISIQQQQQQQQHQQFNAGNGQTLPSLVTAMGVSRGGLSIGQHLAAQFQNNNNDWHMIDHNAAEQSSAESLLRSALQGKGYTKGLHQMHNGSFTILPSSSPTVKDDEMRNILFSTEADSLTFADSTLNTAQIFEESQHHTHMIQLPNSAATTSNGSMSQTNQTNSNLMCDDMFLSLENAFSDDFDKMKRIANEVQQYCHTPPVESDYMNSDIIMQISPSTVAAATATAAAAATTSPTKPVPPVTNQLPPLHSPSTHNLLITQPTSPLTTGNTTTAAIQLQHQQQQRKTEVTTSTSTTTTTAPGTTATTANNRNLNPTKITKKYKRATSSSGSSNTNNNNSLNALNHNNNNNNNRSITNPTSNNSATTTITKNSSNATSSTNSTTSSGSSSSSSNSPPTSQCNGQRKERSLHYCSICSKGFKDKYSVNVHIRTHTGEKPFACSLCGKSFRQKAHLAKHYQTHIAQKNNHAGGGLVKGNAAKHQRSSTSNVVTQQRQQLGMLANSPIGQMASPIGPNVNGLNMGSGGPIGGNVGGGLSSMGINPNLLGVTSTVVSLNGPANSACLATNILTQTNGLLTNR